MNNKDILSKAYSFTAIDANTDGKTTEEIMADFTISLIGTREFIDLQSTLAYEAGQRAERERIADKLDKIYEQPSETDRHWVVLDFISELIADPAESGRQENK